MAEFAMVKDYSSARCTMEYCNRIIQGMVAANSHPIQSNSSKIYNLIKHLTYELLHQRTMSLNFNSPTLFRKKVSIKEYLKTTITRI